MEGQAFGRVDVEKIDLQYALIFIGLIERLKNRERERKIGLLQLSNRLPLSLRRMRPSCEGDKISHVGGMMQVPEEVVGRYVLREFSLPCSEPIF